MDVRGISDVPCEEPEEKCRQLEKEAEVCGLWDKT